MATLARSRIDDFFPFVLILATISTACAPVPQRSAVPTAAGANVAGVGHFWTQTHEFLASCPEVRADCVGDLLQPGMGFTVIGGAVDRVVRGGSATTKLGTYVPVRLDDGRTGFFPLEVKTSLVDPKAVAARKEAEREQQRAEQEQEQKRQTDERRQREQRAEDEAAKRCRGRPSIEIGMTQQEALASKWGRPWDINTTETATHKRAQWVYNSGPECKEDGTPNKYGGHGYLYFDDGKLTTIQKSGG
jgi:hypothetical protein